MGNQKIKHLIFKIFTFIFIFLGQMTMSYAENFDVKHLYSRTIKSIGIPYSETVYTTVISTDDNIITENLISMMSEKIDSDTFGIFKSPLSEKMKQRTIEINQFLNFKSIEEKLTVDNDQFDFYYRININRPQITRSKLIGGFNFDLDLQYRNSNIQKEREKEKNTLKINQYLSDLGVNGRSQKTKFADFYGIANIIPKDYGLLVVLTLKNVGPFDVTLTNPKEWQDILKDEFYEKYEKKWYELNIGGLYKGEGCWMRFTLLPKYLIKEDLNQEELSGDSLKISSNSERVIRFLIPYKEIKVKLNNGDVDTNRTKEGYIHLDHNAAIILSNWNLDISFGDLFSKRTWKEEKSSQVKGWVNLE